MVANSGLPGLETMAAALGIDKFLLTMKLHCIENWGNASERRVEKELAVAFSAKDWRVDGFRVCGTMSD